MERYRPIPVNKYGGVAAKDRQQQRRERLIAAGFKLFATIGFANTSIQTLAETANCALRTFYEEFGTREALLLEMYDRTITAVLKETLDALEATGHGGADLMRAGVDAYVAAMTRDTEKTRIALIEVVGVKQNFVTQAHAAGLRIFEATTAPSCYCEEQNPAGFGTRFPQGFGEEAVRFDLVSWERATTPIAVEGTLEQPSGADGIIDFDGALTDPTNTSYMLVQYDSDDDVHPNAAGYAAMVKEIPIAQF